MRPSRLGLALVLAAAAALRFWALGHDIPEAIPPEEHALVERAFEMMRAGTLDPGFYDFGQLPLYLQLGISVIRFLAGSTAGEWYALNQATVQPFYIWGRALMAGAGTITVLLVYLAGLRWGSRPALLAAALMAVVPLHVDYSHRAVPDTLMTMFVALTILLSLVASERGALRAFVWAGVAAGLATACRYHAVVAIVIPLIACVMQPVAWRTRGTVAAAVVGAAFGGFVVGAPYTFLDFPAFLNRFAELASMARDTPPSEMAPPLYYLRVVRLQFSWPGTPGPVMVIGLPGLLLALTGFAIALVRAVRGPGRPRWAILAGFAVCYFWFITARPVVDARYLLPLLPAIALLVATAVIVGVSLLRRLEFPRGVRTALIALLTLAALGPAAVSAVTFNRQRSKPTTTKLAYEWIRHNLSPGDVVLVEGSVIQMPTDMIHGRGIRELGEMSVEDFSNERVRYVVASSTVYGKYFSQPQSYRREYLAYTRLFSEAQEVAKFSPDRKTRGPELRVLRLNP